jgi:hypothetical protein
VAPLAAGGEFALGVQPANAATMDFGAVALPGSRGRLLVVQVSVALAWTTAGQATIQLFAGRTAAATVDAQHPLIGSTANLGGAGATGLAVGAYFFSPTQLAELASAYPCLGARLVLPSALTAGSLQIFAECATT